MKRWPVLPTAIVALCVAAMIALGLWQLLDRLPRKEAFLAQLAVNPAQPAIPFPGGSDERLLFRRAGGTCAAPGPARLIGAGAAGFRVIVPCRQGMIVQLGTTRDPMAKIAWRGGAVTGYISHAPDSRSLIGTLFDHSSVPLMLVAAAPPPGLALAANSPPDLSAVPNNHLSYAVQWFLFAGIATIIYLLALRRRG